MFSLRLFAFTLTFAVIFGFTGCSEIDQPLEAIKLKPTPVMEFSDTTRMEMRKGNILNWKLKTLHLERWGGTERIFAKPVIVDLYDSLGQPSAWLKADSSSMDEDFSFINAQGHVEARSVDGATVLSDSLIWDKKSNLVRTLSRVKVISQNGDVLIGKGFESDAKLKEWRILSDVKAIFQDAQNRGANFVE